MWGILICLALLRPPLLQRVTPFSRRCAAPSSALQFAREISQDAPCLIEHIDAVSKDPEVLESLEEYYRRVLDTTDYLRPSAQKEVRRALEVALLAHHGQRRRSGEPFITHPVAVAIILAQSQMEKSTIIAGLLHDTVEDTSLTFHELERLFGSTVRKIVEGETKVSKLPKMVRSQIDTLQASSKAEEQMENMRSMFIAMADDWRVVVVKLADRLHNMRTLQYMPVHKRASIARETLEIFSPLAHRLGMWQYKTELADLSFKYLFPDEYDDLSTKISSKFVAYERTLEDAQQTIENLLLTDPWLQGRLRSVHVGGRTKSIYSTFKKMQRHECGIEKIHDLVALRVVLCPEPETADGATSPGLQKSKQHSPEEENALCYHVLGKVHSCWTPMPRTLKDYISSPKPNGYRSLHTTVLCGTQPLEVQIRTQAMHLVAEYGAAAHWAYKDEAASLPWLQIIRQWQVQVDSAHEFMQLVRRELLGTRVFVFTRNGRILNLAKGATLGDAAKHLNISLKGTVPMLNGANAPPATELLNGDIVAFERSSMLLPGLAPAGAYDARPSSTRKKRPQGWQLCPDCQPLPGDELIGAGEVSEPDVAGAAAGAAIGDGSKVAASGTIHCAFGECPSLAKELDSGELTLVDAAAHRQAFRQAMDTASKPEMGYHASIVVFCKDRRGMLMDVASVVTNEATNIVNVNSEIFNAGGKSAFKYSVMVQNRTQLENLMEAVRRVPDVTEVVRGRDYR
jgi:GTP pyrophosphokinase|eukprot:jgi/Chrpa1/21586/Chrysochromulina_OHIO_Genome00003792-RA